MSDEIKKETKKKTAAEGAADEKPREAAGALKAVGQAACKSAGLRSVWVTTDGQCFAQENDARSHAKCLGQLAEPIKVEA